MCPVSDKLIKTINSCETKEKRDHFLKHHIELIKQAAPLLWGVEIED